MKTVYINVHSRQKNDLNHDVAARACELPAKIQGDNAWAMYRVQIIVSSFVSNQS
jgi:hypothetical protein